MNRTTSIVVGIVLLVTGGALLIYRTQGGAGLPEPMPMVLTLAAVAALLGGIASLRTALRKASGSE